MAYKTAAEKYNKQNEERINKVEEMFAREVEKMKTGISEGCDCEKTVSASPYSVGACRTPNLLWKDYLEAAIIAGECDEREDALYHEFYNFVNESAQELIGGKVDVNFVEIERGNKKKEIVFSISFEGGVKIDKVNMLTSRVGATSASFENGYIILFWTRQD